MTCSNKQYSQIQLRRGSSAEFASLDPILASGEPAYAVDVKLFKIGDGLSPWNSLSGIYLDTSLTQFSPVSSNTFASLITDETGSGLLVFNDSPTFTGIPLAPTASSGTNSNQIATTSFVRTEVANLVDSAPSVLDTLNELAAAINDDASFYVTINNNINSVSGSIPFVTNSGDNRIVTSDGTNRGINAENNLTFDGSLLSVSGDIVANTGTFSILQLDTDGAAVSTQGQIGWNDTEGTIDIALTNSVTINVGEHTVYRLRNETGGPLYKGQAVYATGVHSNGIINPSLYVADGSVREIRFMGLLLENINNNNNGYAVNFGHIFNIDTRGNVATNYAVGDETWADGDILYVHPTVAGKLTKVEPKHSIAVAIVLDAANNGKIFVRPTSYGHLSDNHDVNVSGATNGQFLQYNSATDYWVPSSSGNFSTLLVNGTGVSVSGHTHTVSSITDFNSSVSGLLPTIANSGDNRILTSIGSTFGINAESNLTFNGTTLGVSGALQVDKINIDDYIIRPTLPFQPGGRYILGISTDSLSVDTTEYGSVRGSGGFSVFGTNNPTIFIQNEETSNYSPELKLYQGSIFSGNLALTIGSYNQNSANAISNNRNINAIVSSDNYDLRLTTASGNIILKPGTDNNNQYVHISGNYILGNELIDNIQNLGDFIYVTRGASGGGGTLINTEELSLSDDIGLSVLWSSRQLWASGNNLKLDWSDSVKIYGNVGINKNNPAYTLDVGGSGNFASGLFVNNVVVSVSGHTHNSSSITDFNSSVSGLLPANLVTGTGVASHIAYWNSSSGIVADSGQLYWDATNNRLGLGTVAPSAILDISQNDAILKIGDVSSNAGTGPRLELNSKFGATDTSAYLGYSYFGNRTYLQHGRGDAGGIELRSANGTPRLYVQNSNGNVGIGTTTPAYQLDVAGSGHFTQSAYIDGDCLVGALKAYRFNGNAWGYDRIIFRSDVNNKITSDANGNYNWLVAGKNWTLSDVGNVGIKTGSPTYTLHVVGSGYFNGFLDVDNIRVDGNTISSTNTNGNIVLAPNGTGDVQVDADTLRVGDSNSASTITTNGTGNLTVNTNGGTNSGSIVINQGSNGNIAITPNGTGEVDLSKVDIDGGSIDNTAIGATTASTGKFKQLYPTVISNGTVSGSVGTDVSTGQIFDMTLSGATTLSNPTNAVDGVTVRWRITQDGTGGHTVALGSEFQIPSSASSPLPWSTAANATDILAATYHAGRSKWDVVAFVPGY